MKNGFKRCAVALAISTVITGCNDDSTTSFDNNGNTYMAPIASELRISGDSYVDSTLTANYKFIDPNYSPRPEGNSVYSWHVDDSDGDLSNDLSIDDAKSKTLLLTDSEVDQKVYFCVAPVSKGGTATTGDKKCSTSVLVAAGNGNKPVASNVSIVDATDESDVTAPSVGDTLTGDYDYSDDDNDPQGTSTFRWIAGSDIIGATAQTLKLTNQQEGKAVKFCVTPVSTNPDDIANSPLIGDEVCSTATDATAPLAGAAPTASKPIISDEREVGSTLTATYIYDDANEDEQGDSLQVWTRTKDGITEVIAKGPDYALVPEDVGASIVFTVTPVAKTGTPTEGESVPSKPITDVRIPAGSNPIVVLNDIVKSDTVYPKVGDTLTGSYIYTPSSTNSSDASIAVWKIDSTLPASQTVQCGDNKDNCTLPLIENYLGKSIEYCVTPKAVDSAPGKEQCTPTETVYGVKVTGTLELGETLSVETFGYASPTFEWNVTTDNITGPVADNNRENKGTEASYLIGDEIYKQIIDPSIDKNFDANGGNKNGIIDDADWQQAIARGDIDANTINAVHYVGKDVELVVTTTEEGVTKLLASQQLGVTGGVYYNADDETQRGIEPTREVTFTRFGISAVYHRPLSSAETRLNNQIGYGAGLLPSNYDRNIAGINWANFKLDLKQGEVTTRPALSACLSLYEGQKWNLPASRFDGKYVANGYTEFGNESVGNAENNNILLIKLTNIGTSSSVAYGLIGNQQSDQHMSPVFGWPTNGSLKPDNTVQASSYWSSTILGVTDPITKTNAVKFYSNGSTGDNGVTNGNFVSCIKG